MKGGKRRNSNSETLQTQSSAPPLSEPTSSVNCGGDFLPVDEEEWRTSQDESEKVEGVEEAFEEEGDSEAEKEYDRNEEQEREGDEGQMTKLADGYYEIETVRRKRVRKGQVQYLIKWRGWPEAANTWEPVDNLAQCMDFIDAYEDSLKSGKSKLTRKRKRKSSIAHVMPKKKQHQQQHESPAAATYNVPAHVVRIEDPIPFPRLNYASRTNANVETNASGVNSVGTPNDINENGVKTMFAMREEEKQIELHSNVCELKEVMTSHTKDVNMTSEECQATIIDTLVNGLQKTDEMEPVQLGRCTGARKRKSGYVKRFTKDPTPYSVEDNQIVVATSSVVLPSVQYLDSNGNNTNSKNESDACAITQIVKPISCRTTTSNNVQDVLVAFEAMRSDGTKVTVDNKFLKANNPLLLIEYYEKNLRYGST